MTDLNTLQFYATPEHSCSYLPNRQAKTLFVDPKASIDRSSYNVLSDLGFRRSGNHIYRPHCEDCNACLSARLPVDNFRLSRSQKRVLKTNGDLQLEIIEPILSDEIYDLYRRYITARHADGDMFPPSREQFLSFLVTSDQETYFYLFRHQQQLMAVAVVDRLEQGQSAIYTFFEPDQPQRSLGRYAILRQIEDTCERELPYLYLGYWIRGCNKMSYKIEYQPIELLIEGQWIRVQRDKENRD